MRDRYAEFTSLIMNINRYIQKIKSEEMKKLGLKGNQVQCIFYLFKEEGGLNAVQLGELCEEDKAAISRTLKALEAKGLIYLAGRKDKYGNPYRLTEAGNVCAREVVAKTEIFVQKASEGMDEESRTRLYDSLELIEKNLKDCIVRKEGGYD